MLDPFLDAYGMHCLVVSKLPVLDVNFKEQNTKHNSGIMFILYLLCGPIELYVFQSVLKIISFQV